MAHWGLLSPRVLGVLLFFTISGFILGLPFARQYLVAARPVSFGFYRRRVTRLEPPYLISMLLLFAMGIVLVVSVLGTISIFWRACSMCIMWFTERNPPSTSPPEFGGGSPVLSF